MLAYFYLALAVIAETTGTALIGQTNGFTKLLPTILTLACYGLSFYLLAIVVKTIPVHLAYAIWSASGILIITSLSVVVFKASLNWQTVLGLALLIVGVVLVNLFGHVHE
ncbi:DMT family transporter [Fructobacillus fructosus]|uniref:Multidrug transporter EmrE and related cation transporters (EmrE) n=1 Tax=Fructobacillus fructosus TaxID=1631 RepID=A0ABM9MSH2_9LACO|nr:multidrug efflux SMR transporter [Fructobacillus fructosus]MBD9365577.1 multidrug efflux SMR transporter [Leuconostoc mesenteroides]KRN53162.1 membrane transporter [Fructobacillus fructosus KCTC 3544]MBC9118913.1 multidrug efflux SMR transporter [Fructobacillus fructosus]MCK8638291.1 multidrug efflux SMR transporter [Fructobacillus fructosus]CAK1234259.1 Multidrug transporter EmrE and related cation transporters (EmrE) [Fructobacillus fructosus]